MIYTTDKQNSVIPFLLEKSGHLCNCMQTKHIGTSSIQVVYLNFCRWPFYYIYKWL